MDSLFDIKQEDYIDLDTALGRVRGNKKLYRRMLDLFFGSEEFENLEKSLGTEDLDTSAKFAHAIKGMTGNLGMDILFEASTKLMNELREGIKDEQTIQHYRAAYQNTLVAAKELAEELDATL